MIVSMVQIQVFMLILARVLGLMVEVPIFSDRTISKSFKMVFIFTFAFLIWFVAPFNGKLLPRDPLMFQIALVNEFIIGLVLATVVRIIFEGIEAAGDLMGAQMGLSVASMLDPATGAQTTVTAKIFRWTVIMLFFMIDGHHFILTALYRSFDILPMLNSWNIAAGGREIADLGINIFAIAIQLSAPILLVIFLLDFCFGLISRVAPQVNVFQLGFQMKPALGMSVFLLMIPLLLERVLWILNMMIEKLSIILLYMR